MKECSNGVRLILSRTLLGTKSQRPLFGVPISAKLCIFHCMLSSYCLLLWPAHLPKGVWYVTICLITHLIAVCIDVYL